MAIIVQNRRTRDVLASPYTWSDGDECWFWTPDQSQAHHFSSRADAKATIRGFGRPVAMHELTFRRA